MKTILFCSLLFVAVAARAQLVTNLNIDLVWPQATEDALRIAYKIDENLRTNGIAPYTNVVGQVTYKVFVSELISARAMAETTTVMAQNEARFLEAFRALQTTNANAYNRIYRIAFNKGTQ